MRGGRAVKQKVWRVDAPWWDDEMQRLGRMAVRLRDSGVRHVWVSDEAWGHIVGVSRACEGHWGRYVPETYHQINIAGVLVRPRSSRHA